MYTCVRVEAQLVFTLLQCLGSEGHGFPSHQTLGLHALPRAEEPVATCAHREGTHRLLRCKDNNLQMDFG